MQLFPLLAPPMLKVAIVETGGVHEEIIPSLIHALAPFAEISVFINERCRGVRGDLFSELKISFIDLHYVSLVSRDDYQALGRKIDAGGYQVVVVSTLQSDGAADWASMRSAPVMGVIHNVVLFQRSERCQQLIQSGKLFPITLAPHVAARLHSATKGEYIDRVAVMQPFFWGDSPMTTRLISDKKIVGIPGGVNYKSRDFKRLLASLSGDRLRTIQANCVEFRVLGGGDDLDLLKSEVREKDLGNVVSFSALNASGRVPYSTYIKTLFQCWMIYPLLPMRALPYRDYKITSAIPTAAGFALPLLLDRWTSQVYRVPSIIFDSSVQGAIDAINSCTEQIYYATSHKLRHYTQVVLQQNRDDMSRLLQLACQ